jgi:tRNA dimethylallyltransferase
MDIVPGKDHPRDIMLYGIDLVDPDESCSVSVWYDSVRTYIDEAFSQNKQVIVVGGTGLYVRSVTDGIETMDIPINHSLRAELETLSITKLQEKLIGLDRAKFDSMNHSDSHNPRRLSRAIEISISIPSPQRTVLAKPNAKCLV